MINCDGLVKIYETDDKKVMALEGLDLTVETGEMLAVIGKSGSGKSTLLNMIGGLETPTAGILTIDGKDISTYSEDEMVRYRRDKVGFVWQKSAKNLFPYLTVLQNVEAVMMFENSGNTGNLKRGELIKKRKDNNKSYALKLLNAVGLQEHKDKLPAQLSGGEQQRAAIAVALANKPDILLADEPTGAVDTKTSSQIQDLFRQLNRKLGLTIIIVTHDMKLAHKVDRVVMISDGKISTEKILKQHYRDMLDEMENPDMTDETHEEYSVLDKAHRVQLSDDMLAAAGIDTNKVKVRIENGRVVIEAEEKKE